MNDLEEKTCYCELILLQIKFGHLPTARVQYTSPPSNSGCNLVHSISDIFNTVDGNAAASKHLLSCKLLKICEGG
jgi:hypothetical protein